jgi:hypothetical protein
MMPNQLAMIIAFYLSRYDKEGVRSIGFKNASEAFQQIAEILGIKKNYIKFRRDEFDPIHPWRKGWQRPMDNRIVKAIEALQDLSEIELRTIVQRILTDKEYHNSEDIIKITSVIGEEEKGQKGKGVFILRGPTGKKAEEIFIDYHKQHSLPFKGELKDTRELGCGYDFEIINNKKYYIEVKGTKEENGGVLFTSKEWEIAKKYKNRYILALVTNVSTKPIVSFINNPTEKIDAKRNIITSIQVQWSASANQIANTVKDNY